jgi:hypothetical protein
VKRHYLAAAVIFLLAALLFTHTTSFSFVHWDDDIDIFENPHIRALDGESLRWMFTDTAYALRYMPLTWLSWALTYQVGGLNPFWFHLGNVLLHALNAALLFLLVRRFSNLTTASVLAVLFWAMHPLRAEVVAWSTARSYLLCSFFLLLSLLLYFRYADRRLEGRLEAASPRRGCYAGAVALYVLSVMTYTPAAGAAPLFLIADWYPLRRLRGWKAWLEKVPFLAAAAAIIVMTARARREASGIWVGWISFEEFGWAERIAQAFYTWAYYLWSVVIPPPASPVYTRLIDFSPFEPVFIASFLFIAAVSIAAILLHRRAPAFTALWFAYLVTLVPALGLTERPHFTNDRYAYIPHMVVAVGLAVTLTVIRRGRGALRAPALAASVLIIVLFAWRTHLETQKWRNSFTLMASLLDQLGDDPAAANVHFRVGTIYLELGQPELAIQAFGSAQRLRPGDPRIPPLIELARRARNARPDGRTDVPRSGTAAGNPPAPDRASPR